jgi:hypothetical protein
MEISWPAIKEAFFAIGSVAGVIAFLRPVWTASINEIWIAPRESLLFCRNNRSLI